MELFKPKQRVEILPTAYNFMRTYTGPKIVYGTIERVVKDEAFVKLGDFHRAWINVIYLRKVSKGVVRKMEVMATEDGYKYDAKQKYV